MARILFVRSLPIDRDARSSKMIKEYRRRGHDVTPLIWSRGDTVDTTDALVCEAPGGYGQGLRGLVSRLKFFSFVVRQMASRRHRYDVVHLVDFDTGCVGVPLARLLGKPVIYDAFDHAAAMAGSGLLGFALSMLERAAIAASAIAIFPDRSRLEQYGISSDQNIQIISNIPDTQLTGDPIKEAPGDGPLRFVYIGTLEKIHRGLEYIPVICQQNAQISFLVGGIGELEEFFRQSAAQLPNLVYVGHQNYDAALEFMANADCLYGPYLLSAPAHRYASPNKMYEHLAVAKPLLTNEGTPPGRLVDELESGFLFDGSFEGASKLILELSRAECRAAGARARVAWSEKYSHIRQGQLDEFFARFINLECGIGLP